MNLECLSIKAQALNYHALVVVAISKIIQRYGDVQGGQSTHL